MLLEALLQCYILEIKIISNTYGVHCFSFGCLSFDDCNLSWEVLVTDLFFILLAFCSFSCFQNNNNKLAFQTGLAFLNLKIYCSSFFNRLSFWSSFRLTGNLSRKFRVLICPFPPPTEFPLSLMWYIGHNW